MQQSISTKFNSNSLLKFVLPSMVMMLFVSIYSMIGSIYAGNFIHQNAMAAINIVAPLFGCVIAISVMFATGSNAIIAKNLGEGNPQEAKEKLTYIFILAIIIGVALSLFTLIFDDSILRFLGSTEELNVYAKVYLRGLACTFPFVFLQVFSQYFCVTLGKPFLGFMFAILATVSNLFVAHLTIVILEMGIIGSALGMAASYVLPGCTFVALLYFKKGWLLHFVKPKRHRGFVTNVCFNGSSEMVTNLAIAVVTMTLNLIMRRLYGEDGIAAVTVIVSLQFFLNSIYIGFGAGVAPIFAFAQGTNDKEQTKTVFKISVFIVAISSLILVILCVIFKAQIVGVFLKSGTVAYDLAINAFSVFSLGYLFAGFNIFASVFFTSVSNGKISALISFLRTFVFILGMLLILPAIFGPSGIWISIPLAELLAIVISIILLIKYRKVYHY